MQHFLENYMVSLVELKMSKDNVKYRIEEFS